MWIGGTTALVTGSIQPIAWAASDTVVTFFFFVIVPANLTKGLRPMLIAHRCICSAIARLSFFSREAGVKISASNSAWLCRGSTMDVELLAAQPQLQPAGRGDRVARTREAIVSSTLTLAM